MPERRAGSSSRPSVTVPTTASAGRRSCSSSVPTGSGGTSTATQRLEPHRGPAWTSSAELRPRGASAWVPDSYLTSHGASSSSRRRDVRPGRPSPTTATGSSSSASSRPVTVFGYALNQPSNHLHPGGDLRRAGSCAVMDLVYDAGAPRCSGSECDNNCGGRTHAPSTSTAPADPGPPRVGTHYERPTGMDNLNNEGFTIAPQTECVGGTESTSSTPTTATTTVMSIRLGTLTLLRADAHRLRRPRARPSPAAGWYSMPVTVSFTCTPGPLPLTGACPVTRHPVDLRCRPDGDPYGLRPARQPAPSATCQRPQHRPGRADGEDHGRQEGQDLRQKRKPKCVGSDALSGLATCTVTQKKSGTKYVGDRHGHRQRGQPHRSRSSPTR